MVFRPVFLLYRFHTRLSNQRLDYLRINFVAVHATSLVANFILGRRGQSINVPPDGGRLHHCRAIGHYISVVSEINRVAPSIIVKTLLFKCVQSIQFFVVVVVMHIRVVMNSVQVLQKLNIRHNRIDVKYNGITVNRATVGETLAPRRQ